MPFDGIVLNTVVNELKQLIGYKVDKIFQPEKDEIHIQFRIQSKKRLKFSINSSMPYITLTTTRKTNPAVPPNFLILLRKYLSGAIITDIKQLGLDRIVIISFLGKNELGDATHYNLVYELMGKHSNLVLLNNEDIIIDSLKRVAPYMSSVRQILPGLVFNFIENKKLNIKEISYEEFASKIKESKASIFKSIYLNFQGISPVFSSSLLYSFNIDENMIPNDLNENELLKIYNYLHDIKSESNYIFVDDDEFYKDFYIVKLNTFENYKTFDTALEMIDEFYKTKDMQLRIKQKSSNIKKLLDNRIKRVENKLGSFYNELNSSSDSEKYKIYGELILSNIFNIQKGMKEISLLNYYDNSNITIPLNENKTPQENSQIYYKKYNKMKKAKENILVQIVKTKNELNYLLSVLTALENNLQDSNIEAIKNELIQEGYIKKHVYVKKKKQESKPHKFVSNTGFNILVGKNNIENDQITFKTAKKRDIWLHTKDIPGSHVIIVTGGKEVDDETLEYAAMLAAYHSKARNSSTVPVDYTTVKNVKKPNGSKPGFVIYFHQKTIHITPDKKLI